MYNDRLDKAQIILRALAGYAGPIDGDPGPLTLAAADRVPARVAPGRAPMTPERRAIAAAQAALIQAGYEPGPVDGYWGPQSDFAFSDWRAANSLGPALPDRRAEVNFGTEAQMVDIYGQPGNPRCTAGRVTVPWRMVLAWAPKQEISEIRCHELIAPAVQRVFEHVADIHTPAQIIDLGLHLFGGCYNLRRKRGGSAWSTHAFGSALDIDPARNRLSWKSDRARLAQADAAGWWRAWEDEGFLSLGRAKNYDWMHVQAPGLRG